MVWSTKQGRGSQIRICGIDEQQLGLYNNGIVKESKLGSLVIIWPSSSVCFLLLYNLSVVIFFPLKVPIEQRFLTNILSTHFPSQRLS